MVRYMIIEDEFYSSERLGSMVARVRPGYRLAARTEDVQDSVQWLKHNVVDLIFMDIKLSDGSCFDILKQVPIQAAVIFITAYGEFAGPAGNFNTVDYLLKPLEEPELVRAIEKFERLSGKKTDSVQKFPGIYVPVGIPGHETEILPAEDIALVVKRFETEKLYTFTGRSYRPCFTLRKLSEVLSRDSFFQVPDSFILNVRAVSRVRRRILGGLSVWLVPSVTGRITVRREHSMEFLRWYSASGSADKRNGL